MIDGKTPSHLRAGVDSVIDRFFHLLDDAPRHTPSEMPMAPSASPIFADRYPDAAAIFDNLHALHDVVSDILMSPLITPRDKRAALLRAAAAYRDDTTAVISDREWREMTRMMSPPVR